MKKQLVKETNYILVQGWMLTKLNLTGTELLIYAIIFGFSQLKGQKYTGSLEYLAQWTNTSKQTCLNNLTSLINKGYIEKEEKEFNNMKVCSYSIIELDTIQNFCIGIQKSLTNNIDNNIVDNTNDINIISTYSQEEQISKKDLELKENIKYIIDYLNEYLGTKYKYDRKDTIKFIKARFKEGYVLDDFYDVIDKKVKEWKGTEFEKYLRPETLFGNKFENYLNSKTFNGKPKISYSNQYQDNIQETNQKAFRDMTKEEQEDSLAKDEFGNFQKF